MQIGPVIATRTMPLEKAPPADSGTAAVFDIENFARIDDETYTPSGGRSATGQEEEFDDPEELDEAERGTKAAEDGSSRKINFFA
jgi:hypothetical protein